MLLPLWVGTRKFLIDLIDSTGGDAQIDKFVNQVLDETGVRRKLRVCVCVLVFPSWLNLSTWGVESVDMAKATADAETGFDDRAGYPRDPRAPSSKAKVTTKSQSHVVVGNENGVNINKEGCTDCDVARAPEKKSTSFVAKMAGKGYVVIEKKDNSWLVLKSHVNRDICVRPLDKGNCEQIVSRWGFNPVSGECQMFDCKFTLASD